MGKTHVWREDAVKPGDVIKLIDELSPEERAAVRKIRELGNTKVLDAKAQLMEEFATEARAKANASKLLDEYPFLDPEPPPNPRPSWALAAVVLNVLVLLCVAGVVVAMRRDAPHPPPLSSTGGHPPAVSQEAEEARPPRKGRVARADIKPIANVY